MISGYLIIFGIIEVVLQDIIGEESLKRMQKILLEKSISSPPMAQKSVVQHESSLDFCSWEGVVCKEGIVKILSSESNTGYKVKSLDWFPPTLRRINFAGKAIDRILHTRRLPHELRLFRAYRCAVSGQIDLRVLPQQSVEIHLRSNSCSGNLDLSCLPQSLRVLDLAYNAFNNVLINNSLLPRTIQEVHLYAPSRKPKVFIQDSKEVDVRIHVKQSVTPAVSIDTYEFDGYDAMKNAKIDN